MRGTVLGGAAIGPVVANAGAPECRTAAAVLDVPLPVPLSSAAVSANTTFAGSDGQETAFAAGGLAELRVAALPQLPISLPSAEIPDALGSVAVPVSGLLQTLLGGAGTISVDLRPALQSLVPDRQLPIAELVRVQGVMAYAGAGCREGAPQLNGSSSVTGLSVLGRPLPVGQALDEVVSLIDSAGIDPSDVDLAQVVLPSGLSFDGATVGPLLQTAVREVLDTLPPIAVPGTLARIKLTPGRQLRSAETLVQQALRVEVAIAGQSLADLVVGEASVRASGVCPAQADAAATDLVLGCTKRRLVLTDVQERRGRVRLLGVADRGLAGRRVNLRFTHTGKVVARATIRPDGSFSASASLPPRRIRGSNAARYQAVAGKERSLTLKLQRRMVISAARGAGGKVTLSGRVIAPLARPVAQITLKRRVSCRRSEVVKRFKPRRDGRFRVTVAAPKGELAVSYRLSTRVRQTKTTRRTSPTYTLPRAIALS